MKQTIVQLPLQQQKHFFFIRFVCDLGVLYFIGYICVCMHRIT